MNTEFSIVYANFKWPYKKSLEIYRMHLVYIYIYIYIYKRKMKCIYIIYILYIYIYIYISLNIIDILCLHIFFWIRSNSRITFIVFWGNWFMNLCIYENIKQALINNGFPNYIVDEQIKRMIKNVHQQNKQCTTPSSQQTYIKLFYRNQMHYNYKSDEKFLKTLIHKNILPTIS